MTFTEHTCVSLTCDTCNEHLGDEGIHHFDTRAEAITYATRDDGYSTSRWVISGDTAMCPSCARKADCAATGHRCWCDHCGASDYDPPYDALVLFKQLADEREAAP